MTMESTLAAPAETDLVAALNRVASLLESQQLDANLREMHDPKLEAFVNQTPAEAAAANDMTTRRELLDALNRIDASLAAKMSAVLTLEAAANYIGVTPEALGQLARSKEKLRPVRPAPNGRAVFRKADLNSYLCQLVGVANFHD